MIGCLIFWVYFFTVCAFIWESAPDPWLFTTNTTFIHYFDFKSKHCYLKCFFSIVIFFTQYSNAVFLRRVYDTLFNVFYFCIYSYIKLFKQVPFAHFERERERERERALWFTHTVCEIMPHRNFSNYLINYLMKKYELYSIIIISPAPNRDWDGATACLVNPLTAGASSAWDQFFEIGLFRDRWSNIPTRLSADSDR